MDLAPAPRAVVFALEDLPETDRQHILSVANHLHLDIRPESWRAPLVLTGDTPAPVPGLFNDIELSSAGPSLMLLALRLLLADAYHWPEQRWLGGDGGYALYAADPRFTADSLSHALSEQAGMKVQRGLLPRGPRPPVSPGDRVPVLGWQVPVLGGKDPVGKLRDLRPQDQRQHTFGGVRAPLGMVPGNLTDRYRLFLAVSDVHRDGDHASARVELLCIDGSLGEPLAATLQVTLADLGALSDGHVDDDEALADLLREVLPSCLLLTPRGELLILDLYHLGLSASPIGLMRFMGLRMCPAPDGVSEDEGAELIDPSLWEPGLLSALLLPEEIRISGGGRFVSLRFSGRRDGLPLDAFVLLDTRRAAGPAAPVAWPILLDGPAPVLAISPDERLLAVAGPAVAHRLDKSPRPASSAMTPRLCGVEVMPPLSPACLDSPMAEEWLTAHAADLLLFALPAPGAGRGLRPWASVSLPAEMRGPGVLSLHFLPDSHALVCHQPDGNLLCTIELPGPGVAAAVPVRASVRPTTQRDLLSLLGAEGGHPLRHLLRLLQSSHHPPQHRPQPMIIDEEIPGLGFLDLFSGGPAFSEARDFSGLLRAGIGEVAEAVLRDYLSTHPHTLDGATRTTLAS